MVLGLELEMLKDKLNKISRNRGKKDKGMETGRLKTIKLDN